MKNIFNLTSFLEGVSHILLLFVAVPLKYINGNELMVQLLGMPHGLFFIAYIILALLIRSRMNWSSADTFAVLIASLIPFGTFYINKRYT